MGIQETPPGGVTGSAKKRFSCLRSHRRWWIFFSLSAALFVIGFWLFATNGPLRLRVKIMIGLSKSQASRLVNRFPVRPGHIPVPSKAFLVVNFQENSHISWRANLTLETLRRHGITDIELIHGRPTAEDIAT